MMKKGFTLIELLVVIAIIAVLATVVFVALNPSLRFQDSRNSRRWNDVNNYITAIHECIVDNDGSQTACVGTLTADTVYEITNVGYTGTGQACNAECTSAADDQCADISGYMVPYLKSLPIDPAGNSATGHTGYSVTVDANGLFTVASCNAEGGATIQVSR